MVRECDQRVNHRCFGVRVQFLHEFSNLYQTQDRMMLVQTVPIGVRYILQLYALRSGRCVEHMSYDRAAWRD